MVPRTQVPSGSTVTVYSYIVAYDSGYAPNPFHGVCTLACCKPGIRRHAQEGDLIVGLTPKAQGHRLVYAMRVTERLTFEQYSPDPRFRAKRPRMASARAIEHAGDNHYEPLGNGRFRQHPSRHAHDDGTEDRHAMRIDLGADRGNAVLVGAAVAYFGSEALALPDEFAFLAVARGYRKRFTAEQIRLVSDLMTRLPHGVHARPELWQGGDESWNQQAPSRHSLARVGAASATRCRVPDATGCARPRKPRRRGRC